MIQATGELEMIYELWDIRSNNLQDAYDSWAEAVESLNVAVETYGEIVLEFLMLVQDDPDEEDKKIIGVGTEILRHIRSAA
jgi:hypothetical protein